MYFFGCCLHSATSLVAQTVKRLPTMQGTWVQSLGREDPGFNPCARKISWRRKWQPTQVFLPGKSHGWRNLIGYSPRGRKESDTTERLHFHLDSWAILPLLNIWDLFYIKVLYKFSSNVRIKRIEIFASECLSYLMFILIDEHFRMCLFKQTWIKEKIVGKWRFSL